MARLMTLPTTYGEAVKALDGRSSRKVAHNTRLLDNGDNSVSVRYHFTDVVTFFADGRVFANTGGWDTVTTRARMRACGLDVYHRKHQLYIGETPFFNAAMIEADGAVRAC